MSTGTQTSGKARTTRIYLNSRVLRPKSIPRPSFCYFTTVVSENVNFANPASVANFMLFLYMVFLIDRLTNLSILKGFSKNFIFEDFHNF